MTEHNHRRGTRRKKYGPLREVHETIGKIPGVTLLVNERRIIHEDEHTIVYKYVEGRRMCNGYPPKTPYGYIDKSMHGWGRVSLFADKTIGAGIGNDFHDGGREMAKAVRGAKKFVRSRFRFHEKAATKKLAIFALDD